MLYKLQKDTFAYFIKEVNNNTGLIADKTQPGAPSSIAATGLGLSCYIAGIERGFITRTEAAKRTLTVLQFFYNSHQGTDADATGYKGFYYHFLDMETGKRVWNCELSTIDTAILMAGILTARCYYNSRQQSEIEIRTIADKLYARVDWQWALNGKDSVSHGWKPESGFLRYRWNNKYSEAHIIYILALGSPTFPISASAYKKWIATFEWKKLYDIDCIYAGPLFIHQMSQIWLHFNGIYDDFNNKVGIDYFENSRRATLIQQQYAIDNPKGYARYGKNGWGFTASDGPGPCIRTVNGVKRQFYSYKARGAPFGPDDGTISPWAVVCSLPFLPDVVLSTIAHATKRLDFEKHHPFGFDASYNPTFPEKNALSHAWISRWQFGLNQGPVILMIENYTSGLIWNIMKKCPYIIKGLQCAGFSGGWLNLKTTKKM
ncbi:glucoamylase family protein [Ferruginibacter sp.]|uniref:glucoamylase family protein n=1 Tax=Ferruginibacter sp. TaxID=1940288 RepID=UPI00265B2AA4|nr:glucoamylase family protein [Ferruginibacter sp.]